MPPVESPGGSHERQRTDLPAAGADADPRVAALPAPRVRVGLPARRAERERPRQRVRRPGRRRQERERHLLQPRRPHPRQAAGTSSRPSSRSASARRSPTPASTVPSAGPCRSPSRSAARAATPASGSPCRTPTSRARSASASGSASSFNVPFGLETELGGAPWMGRFHATKSKVEAYNVNPTIAFKVTDAFSIGVGANWQHLKADLGQRRRLRRRRLLRHRSRRVGQGLPAGDPGARRSPPCSPQLGPLGRRPPRSRPSSPAPRTPGAGTPGRSSSSASRRTSA